MIHANQQQSWISKATALSDKFEGLFRNTKNLSRLCNGEAFGRAPRLESGGEFICGQGVDFRFKSGRLAEPERAFIRNNVITLRLLRPPLTRCGLWATSPSREGGTNRP